MVERKYERARRVWGEETYVLCRSMARQENEKAIHDRFSSRMEKALSGLQKRIAAGKLKDRHKVEQRWESLEARHPQMADLYEEIS